MTEQTTMQQSFESRLDELYDELNNTSTEQQLVLPNFDIIHKPLKLYWTNVKKFLRTVNRPSEHFIEFLTSELNVEINQKTDSLSDGYVIIGKLKKDKLINTSRKYVNNFCRCKTCNSFNTNFIKNNKLRMFTILCNDCNSEFNI